MIMVHAGREIKDTNNACNPCPIKRFKTTCPIDQQAARESPPNLT